MTIIPRGIFANSEFGTQESSTLAGSGQHYIDLGGTLKDLAARLGYTVTQALADLYSTEIAASGHFLLTGGKDSTSGLFAASLGNMPTGNGIITGFGGGAAFVDGFDGGGAPAEIRVAWTGISWLYAQTP